VTSAEYQEGRKDGLSEAMAIMLQLEADVAVRLERRAPTATTRARQVRRQAYKNGAARIATRLRKARPGAPRVRTALARLCLL
jgi:hypothetical protein